MSDDMRWMENAACKGLTTLFFGDSGDHAKDAKEVCATCSVLEQCREWALSEYLPSGVCGGMTPKERRRLRREANASKVLTGPENLPAACGTDSGYYRHRREHSATCAECRAAHSAATAVRAAKRPALSARTERNRERRQARIEAGWCRPCTNSLHSGCRQPCTCTGCYPLLEEAS